MRALVLRAAAPPSRVVVRLRVAADLTIAVKVVQSFAVTAKAVPTGAMRHVLKAVAMTAHGQKVVLTTGVTTVLHANPLHAVTVVPAAMATSCLVTLTR